MLELPVTVAVNCWVPPDGTEAPTGEMVSVTGPVVVEVLEPKLQAAITDVRTAGLNIMMSMKEEGKPVSFVEDCAVPLEHLAEYT